MNINRKYQYEYCNLTEPEKKFIMIAEILATGDEIRTGALIDTNSAYISEKLEEMGIDVVRHTCVGDDSGQLVSVLKEIGSRTDIAVVTGGLGPTTDDLSAQAAAEAAGVELILNEDAKASMEVYFKKRGRPLPSADNKQMLLPQGSECLINAVGTAPGFSLGINACVFFFMPGVPHEMRRMFSDQVLPRIEKQIKGGREVHLTRTISTFGLPESEVNRRLLEFPDRFPEIKLGLRATFPEVQVKVYGRGTDQNLLKQQLEHAAAWIGQQIGKRVFSMDGRSMEAEVGRLLLKNQATLAVAESCTGGLIAHQLTNVAGSSEYFLFSGVTYSNEAKVRVLGVSPETLKTYGAVHEETAKEMAAGAKRLSGATYALATSGIAGPGGGSPDKPVGTVCIGLATPESVTGRRYQFTFTDRFMNKQIFAMMALELLRRELIKTARL